MGSKLKRKNKNRDFPGADTIIFTDGGCERNPGGRGAYGIVILDRKTGRTETYSGAYESTTNNRMEMMAVLEAVKKIKTSDPVVLYSDSKYVVSTMRGEFARKRNLDLWGEIDRAMKDKTVMFAWVQGHSGHKYNEMCDEMCTRAMETGPYAIDEGYIAASEKRQQTSELFRSIGDKTPVEGVVIVPEELDKKPECTDSQWRYQERYAVHAECAKQICHFYQYDFHGFKHYAELKSGGKDYWSMFRKQELESLIGPEKQEVINRYLTGEDATTATRWHCRGLRLSDAIKKVLADKNVRNAGKK